MNNTADFNYKKYLQLIIKKKYLFVVLALIIMIGVTVTSYILPERYVANCTVFIEKSVISELVKGIAITPSFDDKLKVLEYTLKSRNLLIKIFDDLGLGFKELNNRQQENMIRDFQRNTNIRLKDREGLFIVSFSDKNPRLARNFVNALVRRYIDENITSKRVESYDATKFLGEQIITIKAKLDEIEERANSFKRENGTQLVQNPGTIIAEIGDAQQKIDEIEIKRRQLESLQTMAKKNDPLKARLTGLQNKQQELGLVYTDNHPEVLETKNEIATIKEQIQSGPSRAVSSPEVEKITMELNSLRDIERNQKRIITSKRALLRIIPATRTAYDELEQEKYSQKNIYDQLQARYRQSEVSKQMEVQDKATTFRIVDPAVIPTQPFSPQRVKMILLGVIGGLVASFAFLVLLDHLDKSVRNVESLKSLGVQILAVVPTIEIQDELQALRKRDYWFYGIAATCFMLILATVPLELMRYMSIDLFNSAEIKTHFKTFTLK